MGAISFGGPAASIALIDEEVMRKRGWIDREHFLYLLAATNLVPGPNVLEMAIHIGQVRAGWWGFMVAGVAFILPAFLISPTLFRSAIIDVWTVIMLGVGLIALLRFRVDTLWLVLGGAFLGLVRYLLI